MIYNSGKYEYIAGNKSTRVER